MLQNHGFFHYGSVRGNYFSETDYFLHVGSVSDWKKGEHVTWRNGCVAATAEAAATAAVVAASVIEGVCSFSSTFLAVVSLCT